jgi:hypothetical protein
VVHYQAQEWKTTPFMPIIGSIEGYNAAVEQLEILSKEPLGTPRTEGVQQLIDAILDYEERHGPEKTAARR